MKHDPFNESSEMYLKTISELAVDSAPVSISALARRLQVSTVSATEMVHRLEEQALLSHQPYKGVCLTVKGRERAAGLIRAHHMWECFLVDRLGIPWDMAHDHACRLEHATETAVTEALAIFLDEPKICPHGNLVPSAKGDILPPNDIPLTQLDCGEQGIITRIFPESTALLSYLANHELKPGRQFTICEIVPFNGPLVLAYCDHEIPLGQEIANCIFVRRIEE